MPRDIKVYDIDGKGVRNGALHSARGIPGTGAPSAAAPASAAMSTATWAGARPGVQ